MSGPLSPEDCRDLVAISAVEDGWRPGLVAELLGMEAEDMADLLGECLREARADIARGGA